MVGPQQRPMSHLEAPMLNILATAATVLGPIGVVLMTVIPLLVGIAAGLTHREDVRCQLDAQHVGFTVAMTKPRRPKVPCGTCRGVGQVPPADPNQHGLVTCGTCGGTGKVDG